MGVELIDPFTPMLENAVATIVDNLDRATGRSAALVQANAIKGIHNQKRSWTPLAEKTLASKQKKGKTEILLTDGDLAGSIEVTKRRKGVYDVGTNWESARAHEFGFDGNNLPARPYIQPALDESKDDIIDNLRDALEETFS